MSELPNDLITRETVNSLDKISEQLLVKDQLTVAAYNRVFETILALRLALAASQDEAEKAKAERDEPVKGPRAQYEISDRQIKRMSDDWDEAKNYESCMAGPASAFGFGWRMSASRSTSSDAWNDLVAKLDSLKAFVQTIAQEKGEYGRYGYNQPTHRALEAQALLAAVSAARADAARKEGA